MKSTVWNIASTIIGGFILALMISECREIRQTHDAVIKMEAKQK